MEAEPLVELRSHTRRSPCSDTRVPTSSQTQSGVKECPEPSTRTGGAAVRTHSCNSSMLEGVTALACVKTTFPIQFKSVRCLSAPPRESCAAECCELVALAQAIAHICGRCSLQNFEKRATSAACAAVTCGVARHFTAHSVTCHPCAAVPCNAMRRRDTNRKRNHSPARAAP